MMSNEKPALLIIDMVKETFDDKKGFPITRFAKKIIPPLNGLIRAFRGKGWPIVFATDAFRKEDFIFTGKMGPHSIEGSEGAEVVAALDRQEKDLWLPKRRFSAFFGTRLDTWLKERGVTLCAVGGITANFCVIASALDAICHDFKVVILGDGTAAASEKLLEDTLGLYRRNPLYPLFRVLSSSELLEELIPPDHSSVSEGEGGGQPPVSSVGKVQPSSRGRGKGG